MTGTMTGTMYDAVNVAKIPADATHVAGYVDGLYKNVKPMRKRFPKALLTTITVTGESVADVLDVEKGDATPSDAPAWVVRMRNLGRRPIVYCSEANWYACTLSFRAESVPEPFWWIAEWTNHAHLLEGSIATQWTSDSWGYDVSETIDTWPSELQRKKASVKLPTQSQLKVFVAEASAVLIVINDYTKTVHGLPTGVEETLTILAAAIAAISHTVNKVKAAKPSTKKVVES